MYEDEIQEWIEYATGKRIMMGGGGKPIREENGFDKKKAQETYEGLVGLKNNFFLLLFVDCAVSN